MHVEHRKVSRRTTNGCDFHIGLWLVLQDLYLPSPIDRLIPLVEFALETPLNRGAHGPTMGTINPGVIWAGKYFQVGMEAVIPINEHTGNNVGAIAQLHFFLDDLFPHTIGRPLFGGTK